MKKSSPAFAKRQTVSRHYLQTMKQGILSLCLLTILIGCDNSPREQSSQTTVDTIATISTPTTIDTIKKIWDYDYVTGFPVRRRTVNPDTLTPEKLIDIINTYHGQEKVKLDLVLVSNDTIFVEIKNSTYLTQQMGTTGADAYISTTVYTLTELKGVQYVHIKFVEGDHAQPGTYDRQYYIDRNEANKANN
jgi:hypothetical protein